MSATETALGLSLPQRRILNVIYTWGQPAGMGCSTLMSSAAAELIDLPALGEAGLITAHDVNGDLYPLDGAAVSGSRVPRCRIKLTDAGKAWVQRPANMLLREIDLAPRGVLALRRAMEIAGDTRLLRQCVEDGYATLHSADSMTEERGFTRKGIEFQVPQYFTLRATRKIQKVLGS